MTNQHQGFPDLLDDYRDARDTPNQNIEWRNLAADRLPLNQFRAGFRWIDGSHGRSWIAHSWVASVADAARDLRELVTIHDNGGTASSPAKIKSAARELLRLLGED